MTQPYLELQTMTVDFFAGAFDGDAVPPPVKGFPAPTLDFDGDGALDADDAAPGDPAAQ
ncbi:hypothetical protein D3C83_185470 [compost metagenome]